MAEQQPPAKEKLPIPLLPTTAYTAKTTKKKMTGDDQRAKKKELDRDKTRVNVGVAFQRWRELRDLKEFKTDSELATFLLEKQETNYPCLIYFWGEIVTVNLRGTSTAASSTRTSAGRSRGGVVFVGALPLSLKTITVSTNTRHTFCKITNVNKLLIFWLTNYCNNVLG